jgi:hypothetical protein
MIVIAAPSNLGLRPLRDSAFHFSNPRPGESGIMVSFKQEIP